jgi:hypothetical protein
VVCWDCCILSVGSRPGSARACSCLNTTWSRLVMGSLCAGELRGCDAVSCIKVCAWLRFQP